ncbi:DUF885 domain-containing protein [Paucibacter sp. Y2R2-4]|uniref:DUF885 domain-containing protein n=1 Tax=Paucibacter sp. Y2R2-4 TaxID=2893553 RepID=UPI0021E48776|nr:DUF885 domain-containing protein [Paucibacter sp. Y2R2-4]MCV2350337.1 DUF885 domain-containing protein [Paucibacter sp. Y2R2-4]
MKKQAQIKSALAARLSAASVLSLSALLNLAPPAFAVQAPSSAQVQAAAALQFETEVDAFLADYWRLVPDAAVAAGRFEAAAQLPAPTEARRQALLIFCERWLQRLADLPGRLQAAGKSALTPAQLGDLALLDNHLRAMRWSMTELRSDQWDASESNVADPFAQLLNKPDYAPAGQRLAWIDQRLRQVPAYYQAALKQLKNPSPVHLKLAIDQLEGGLVLFREDIPKAIKQAGLKGEAAASLQRHNAQALRAVLAHIAALKRIDRSLEQSGGGRSFRLGKALFEAKFDYEIQASVDAAGLYQRALADKARLLQRMDELSEQLWPGLFGDAAKPADRFDKIGRVIDKLSERHVAPERFVDEIKSQIPALAAWVTAHDLLSLDPSRPLVVRETPAYMRGVAGASISAPGPLDPKGDTYYNVDPLDKYTPAEAESFLREYNHWMLQVLNIHEAIPGHYVQLLHANKSPSKIKTLFGNGAMVEGWAVYAERMMMESGWGAVDGKPSLEMGLMYAKWNLRVVSNAILDYSVHVLGMSESEALQLLEREAFQSKTEAKEKWHRAQVSSAQLSSYFAGFSEILALREQLKAQRGEAFKLKAFHEEFLSHGSAPVRMVRRLMLEQAAGLRN